MHKFRRIYSTELQTTLAKEFEFFGVSISGKPSRMVCRPAKADSHLSFLVNDITVKALAEHICQSDNSHTTCLSGNRGVIIKSVEHVLSAFWGMGVDNAELALVDGTIPFADASAIKLSKEIFRAGLVELNQKRIYVEPTRDAVFNVANDDRFCLLTKSKDNLSTYSVVVEFPPPVGRQDYKCVLSSETYLREIASARTFLRSAIDKDGDVWSRVRRLYPFLPKDPKKSPIIVYYRDRFLVNPKQNEIVKHKLLDYIGDMSLVGYRIRAHTQLFKPGHKFTHHIAKEIRNSALASID